jgi:phosphotransferase system enzyme I (PtsI)
MSAMRIHGRCAAPGFALGPIHRVVARRGSYQPSGSPKTEAARLAAAIASALATLEASMGEANGEASDMLGFQVAMLADAALAERAFHAIEAGDRADQAWATALDQEIAGYLDSTEEHFRARASDLRDIKARVSDCLTGASQQPIPRGAVVVADDLPPSQFLATDWTDSALLLRSGSPTSHVAILARARGVPMVVGLNGDLAAGRFAAVDAAAGAVIIDPSPEERQLFAVRRQAEAEARRDVALRVNEPALTADGERVTVLLNISDPRELEALDPATCDGIGLVRTELLFEGRSLPDEEHQLAVYRRIAEWAGSLPTTIRTLDAGGDKPIPGLTPEGESNPFLGLRGVRLTLAHPQVFRTQLRALARAAAHGAIEVMIPMIAVPREFNAVRKLMDEVVLELEREGKQHRRPPLGMMVEVPSAAIAIDRFDADFYSIGSNDLVQYVVAAGRDIAGVADLAKADEEAVLRLIVNVVDHGVRTSRKVSLCGDAGGDPAIIPALLICGVRHLSMSPALVASAKAAIAAFRMTSRD